MADLKRGFGSWPIVEGAMPAKNRTLDLMYKKRPVSKENLGEKRNNGKDLTFQELRSCVLDDSTRNNKQRHKSTNIYGLNFFFPQE